ncbi:hypothetical protein ANANG_G00127390 [Anguilla anguilla]|uniref:Uncharacterized protein n=1 Tax=Anguilla anguilla TaxID=7936 RepID=A0A9D3MHW3_ANGAN|nr:hypothetical protein ANANG_G00127390 [Anguilla anguilla]
MLLSGATYTTSILLHSIYIAAIYTAGYILKQCLYIASTLLNSLHSFEHLPLPRNQVYCRKQHGRTLVRNCSRLLQGYCGCSDPTTCHLHQSACQRHTKVSVRQDNGLDGGAETG